MSLTLPEFITRWQGANLTERSASQSHFIDLCELLGQPKPVDIDQTGAFYTFEKGAHKTEGGDGFADVWLRDHFGWEYKGKKKNLEAAYKQLLQYREDLENPPLLVVCDLNKFEVHTNFTGTAKRVYAFDLNDLASPKPTDTTFGIAPFEVLRVLFTNPELLKPTHTAAQVTEAAAKEFASLADSLRKAGAEPAEAAHFLMRLLFCLFAEDIGLLPPKLFSTLVKNTRFKPIEFTKRLSALFDAMATGGAFGVDDIAHFDGDLFADAKTIELTVNDMDILARACEMDWASIEPAIFGTLFERSLDPSKRSQLGAHYTSRDDILLVVEPVLMEPLRREWVTVREHAEAIIQKRDAAKGSTRTKQQQALERLLIGFTGKIASISVLDPACGSGNFLYVALKRLLGLEKEVIIFAANNGTTRFFPQVDPAQLHGIEINAYAHQLAQIVVWIGYIQWLHDNGFGVPSHPILKPLHNILKMDAVLAFDEYHSPIEPEWPKADFIIGNPPFLGGKLLRRRLGDDYVGALFTVYKGRVPHSADFVCYWFERAHRLIAQGEVKRVGLLATQAIRGGTNRKVLHRIKEVGDIFLAWSDHPWVNDGANVRVSIVGMDNGTETHRELDGIQVQRINPDLTSSLDFTTALPLAENHGIAFQGAVIVGPFDIPAHEAVRMLAKKNLHGRSNSDVIKPVVNAADLTGRSREWFIIDFAQLSMEEASLYEAPFEYVKQHVKPLRELNNDRQRRDRWWLHGRSGEDLRIAAVHKSRLIATPRVSKHRVFVWINKETVVTDAVVAIACDDDYFFGLLQSRPHALWALRQGTQLESRPRYTPTTTFETYPFPWSPGTEPINDLRVQVIAAAAKDLVEKRDAWLNPPGATEADLEARTLTNLYNQRPTWLELAHRKLDETALDAYGWPRDIGDDEILEHLLALNLQRAAQNEESKKEKSGDPE